MYNTTLNGYKQVECFYKFGSDCQVIIDRKSFRTGHPICFSCKMQKRRDRYQELKKCQQPTSQVM